VTSNVADLYQVSSADDAPTLIDLDSPALPTAPVSLAGPPVTPAQRIAFYSADDWEMFIREWASGLRPGYAQIKRLGGTGDRGVDIAGFKTEDGFEGGWDCFQGKHYADPLTWSDAFPEMLKILLGVVKGHFTTPDAYAFLAPKGCGTSLNRLLSTPTSLRQQFLDELNRTDGPGSKLEAALRDQVRALANSIDFALFRSVELVDAIATHRTTPYHVARFGGPLPARPAVAGAPATIAASEARYVEQLMEVYREADPSTQTAPDTIPHHARFGTHFQRQRESFYSAEALRLHARDAVPPGTFEALQDDVHAGVIEVADAEHPTGMARLIEVLQASTQVDLSMHALTSISRLEDRKGICHQLANQDRLTWMREQS